MFNENNSKKILEQFRDCIPLFNVLSDELRQNIIMVLKEVIKAVREVWTEELPLILRVSAEEYAEGGNKPEDTAEIINLVKDAGIDMIDVSSGILVTSSLMVEEILQNNRADLVYLGRELLRNPYWPLQAAKELHYDTEWPVQYLRSKETRKGGF